MAWHRKTTGALESSTATTRKSRSRLRSLRHALARQQAAAIRAIEKYFPAGSKVTRPQGGYFVWVELPADIDALSVHRQAVERGIGIAPGHLFSADQRYRHHLRINHGYPGDPRTEEAFKVLGEIIRDARAPAAA